MPEITNITFKIMNNKYYIYYSVNGQWHKEVYQQAKSARQRIHLLSACIPDRK